jgi:hypothetical protein
MVRLQEVPSIIADRASRATPILGLAAHIGRGVGRLAADAVVRTPGALPRSIDKLDAGSLSRLMQQAVTSFSVIDGHTGTSSRARLALKGNAVPESVFVKMPAATAATRMLGELASLGETEVRFYRDLSPKMKTGVPLFHGSTFNRLTGRYVLVLEDLTPRHCRFPDTLQPLDADDARRTVEVLARLHGTFWNELPAESGGDGPLGWLWSASADPSVPLTGQVMKLSIRRLEKRSIPVGDGAYIAEHYPAVARRLDAPPHTVLHGDAHPGNLYFSDGEAGLLDWQVVRRGHPMRDVAYALILGMTTADRRTHQRDLLDHYRTTLAATGGPQLDHDEIWRRYQEAAAYAYVSPLTTVGLGGMQTDEIGLEGLRRAVAALEDLDTVAVLQQQ